MKPGYKTTEFWVTIIANALDFLSSMEGALPPEKAAYVAAFINGAYAISRGLAKK
jgi:hypothetical protein